MNDIRNYYQISVSIATSGQPTAEQFATIAEQGYALVVNLAMPDSVFAIADEAQIVGALGMEYLHLPVAWEAPTLADLERFFALMQAHQTQKIWVHCALNKRASCFMYLYNLCVLQRPEAEARLPMAAIWQPTGVWETFINTAKNSRA
jgi:protein tyrosine phosphatase (PTP) superfamily phosphohydrolase (DUF442 family)